MLSDPVPIPADVAGPYFPRSWDGATKHQPPGTVVLLRVPGTWTARIVRDETAYRMLAAGLTMPECYVCREGALV